MSQNSSSIRPVLWAPHAQSVDLVLGANRRRVPLQAETGGRFRIPTSALQPAEDYGFSLDAGIVLPDPYSCWQPHGVHGPSRRLNFDDFEWTDGNFEPTAFGSAILYELHVGTFTEAGTFDAIVEHLPELVDLGITHLELLPVGQFPGTRGWGYDGVNLFAPHTAYGGPGGLMRLVNACHTAGLAVLLDVVYNHLGPSGNYLNRFGPYFTSRYQTPWGDALNFDGAGSDWVRRFVCDNALHWLDNYHIDGLRLDATHAMFDQTANHILTQLSSEVRALSQRQGKRHILIAESCRNDPRVSQSSPEGGFGFDSQWNDDLHHSLHGFLTAERAGYYCDFGALEQVATAVREGFVLQGQYSKYRDRCHGGSSAHLLGTELINYIQNHDQVGNRPRGDRLASTLSFAQLQLSAAVLLLAPHTPMLFMGEEWGSQDPFHYFTDHDDSELGNAIRLGRQREFRQFGWNSQLCASSEDPQGLFAFEQSQLRRDPENKNFALTQWYRELIQIRKRWVVDSLPESQFQVRCENSTGVLCIERSGLLLACNFSATPTTVASTEVKPTLREPLLVSSTAATAEGGQISLPAYGVWVGLISRPAAS